MAFDWDIAAKGVGGAVALIGGAIQLATRRGNLTASLKADLDILEKLRKFPEDDQSYRILKEDIDRRIQRKYGQRARQEGVLGLPKATNRGQVTLGAILLIGLSIWTAYLVRNGFTWWALLPAFFAFSGLGMIMSGFEQETIRDVDGRSYPQASRREDGEQAEEPASPEPVARTEEHVQLT